MSKNKAKKTVSWQGVAVHQSEPGTKVEFIGGVNKDRIGGNCSVIEHTDENNDVTRVMFDLGCLFTPYESGFSAAYPDVSDYFDRTDPDTGEKTQARKPVAMLCLTHAH